MKKKYKALEDIVRQLDDGELSMSELLNQYKKGLTFSEGMCRYAGFCGR